MTQDPVTPPVQFGLPWTIAEYAAALAGRADPELIEFLVRHLRVPETGPGRYDAADLLGLHDAIRPWLERRAQSMVIQGHTEGTAA